jgi:hypothetical protein
MSTSLHAALPTTIRAILADETLEGPVTITATVTAREDYLSGGILPWVTLALGDGDASIRVEVRPREYNQRTIEPTIGTLVTVTGQLVTDNGGLIILPHRRPPRLRRDRRPGHDHRPHHPGRDQHQRRRP